MYFIVSLLWKQPVWGFSHSISPVPSCTQVCSEHARTWEAAVPQGGSTQPSASLVSEHPCLSLFCTGGSITHIKGPGHSWRHGIAALLPRLPGKEPEAACRHSGAYWSLCLWSPSYSFPSVIFTRIPNSSESVQKRIIFLLDTFPLSVSWFFINPQTHSASVWPSFFPSVFIPAVIHPSLRSLMRQFLFQSGRRVRFLCLREQRSLCPSLAPLVATQEDQSCKKLPLLNPVQPDVLLESASDSWRTISNLAEVSDHGSEHVVRAEKLSRKVHSIKDALSVCCWKDWTKNTSIPRHLWQAQSSVSRAVAIVQLSHISGAITVWFSRYVPALPAVNIKGTHHTFSSFYQGGRDGKSRYGAVLSIRLGLSYGVTVMPLVGVKELLGWIQGLMGLL